MDAVLDEQSEKTTTAVIVIPANKVKDDQPARFNTKFEDRDGRQVVQVWTAEKKEGRKFYVAVSLLPNGFVKASTRLETE